jgi:hypothetical protein
MSVQPWSKSKNITDINTTVNTDIISSLNNIQTIVVCEKALTFERNKKVRIKTTITETMIDVGIVDCNGKEINLTKEKDIFARVGTSGHGR